MKLLASILVASAFGQDPNARRRGNKGDAAAADTAADYGGFGDYGTGGDYGTFGGDYGGTTDFGAYGDYADSFGTADYSYGTAADDFGSYDSYGTDDSFAAYSDYSADDTAAFEEVAAEVAVEAAPAPAAPARPAAPAGPAVATIREFQADDTNRPGGGFTQVDPVCMTGSAFADGAGDFSTAQLANLVLASCEGGASGLTTEDVRDYCLIEVRTVNGLYSEINGRCVSYSDCEMALTNNFQHPNGVPSLHDSCKPEMNSGRFTNKESVCRTCSHMIDVNNPGNYALGVTTNTATLTNSAGAALADSDTATDMKLWNRAFWMQFDGTKYDAGVHFALQQSGK